MVEKQTFTEEYFSYFESHLYGIFVTVVLASMATWKVVVTSLLILFLPPSLRGLQFPT